MIDEHIAVRVIGTVGRGVGWKAGCPRNGTNNTLSPNDRARTKDLPRYGAH